MKLDENKALFEELNQAVQWAGTLTVIHTNAIAHQIGLSATEFEAMDLISRFQPMTAGKLAEYCGLTSGAITGLVDRLERQGFVRRERDPADRRRVFIVPVENEEAKKKVRALYKPMATEFRKCAENYTKDEICLLLKMQKEANTMVEQVIAKMRKES
ncbi:MAG TPA: MarR family transcriptional regulator [Candidatus Saccharimonadales bacterium]|nr:MarR family transcriptional regulator [Candidatus Saccharimonadales bacterium]